MTQTTLETETHAKPTKGRDPHWLRWVGGAIVGGLLGFGGALIASRLLPSGIDNIELAASQLIAMLVAAMALAVGIIVTLMSFSKRIYESENWTAESDDNEHARVAPTLRWSGTSLMAMGVEFVALAMPVAPERALPVIAVIAATLLVQGWASWRIWNDSDELQRAAILEGSAISCGVILFILSLWVPLAVYGFVGFDPLTVVLMVTAASIVPAIWISVQRGLTQ